MRRRLHSVLWLCLLTAPCAAAQDFDLDAGLQAMSRNLQTANADGNYWLALSGTADLALYHVDKPPAGLLATDQSTAVAPRISMTLDAGAGPRTLAHLRVTADRGFDPVFEESGDARVDEAFVQVELHAASRTQLRLGKFATLFGAFVDRHLPQDNPMINAPLGYDDLLTVTDGDVPIDSSDFLVRRDQPDDKPEWLTIAWGPSYATGASLTTQLGRTELGIEVKNASLSSRPDDWTLGQRDFGDGPTTTARARWRPNHAWSFGASYSQGAYLRERAASALAPGEDIDQFEQQTAGIDISYAHRRVQIWSELIHSQFEVPNVGDVAVTSAFAEVRYKAAPQIWVAGRLSQSRFDDVDGQSWDRNVQAADVALGYRFSPRVQGKLQYRWIGQQGSDTNGNHVLAVQWVAWF